MNLQLKGVQKVINELAKINNEVSREVDGELQSSCNLIAKKADRIAPVNFGELRKEIGSQKVAFMQYTVFSNAPHAGFVEFGTRGKAVVPPELQDQARAVQKTSKGNWDQFVNSIYTWGLYKKIIKKGDKNHAVNIARKIYKFGISPQPYLWPSFVAERSKLVRRITDIVKKKR